MRKFNVIWQDFNTRKFEEYDIIPYFIREYQRDKEKEWPLPKTFIEFKDWVTRRSVYQFWGRCEYELILCGWPNEDTQEKWDIHRQIMMNIDLITELIIQELENGNTAEESNQ